MATEAQAGEEFSQRGTTDTRVKAEHAHQYGVVFYASVAVSVAFVLAGALFREPFNNALKTVVQASPNRRTDPEQDTRVRSVTA